MTIDALRRLIELLTDTAGYAAALDQTAMAADLTQGAAAAPAPPPGRAACRPPPRHQGRLHHPHQASGADPVMTVPSFRHHSPGSGLAGSLALAAVLIGACGRPQPHTPATTTPPGAATPAPTAGVGPPASTGDIGPATASSPAGLFGALPAAATTTTGPAAGGGAGRSDPVAVARAYATGLFTVDWTKPTPTAQKVAATRPLAIPAAAVKLAHGQYYQPDPADPRVASHEVDTVDRVDVAAADPVPGANTYAATVHLTVRSDVGVTATQTTVILTVIHQPDGWLVDDTQVVE